MENKSYSNYKNKLKDLDRGLFSFHTDKILHDLEITRQKMCQNFLIQELIAFIIILISVSMLAYPNFILLNSTIIYSTFIVFIMIGFVISFFKSTCLADFILPCLFWLLGFIIAITSLIFPFLAFHVGIYVSVIYIVYNIHDSFREYKKIMKEAKTKIFENAMNIECVPEAEQFTNEEIKNSLIFSRYDIDYEYMDYGKDGVDVVIPIEIDDTFEGNYRGVNFAIEEVTFNILIFILFNSIINKDNQVWNPYYKYPIFKGVIIKFEQDKTNSSKVLFSTKKDIYIHHNALGPYVITFFKYILLISISLVIIYLFHNYTKLYVIFLFCVLFLISSFLAYIYHFISKLPKLLSYKSDVIKDLKPVKLESPEWEKHFKAYSNDQVEARYMLTTAFMERFLNLTTAFGTDKAKCSFYDDKIMIAISTKKDLFEFGNLFKPVSKDKFYEELNSIIEMIDYFKLDTHTGL